MEPSKVYFTDFHATPHETLLQKLHRLMKTAGFEQIGFTDKFVAIKLHFGEMNHPDAEWETCLIHAEKIGIGTRSYQLVTI